MEEHDGRIWDGRELDRAELNAAAAV